PSTRCPPPSCNATHNALTSSPTRRSSDLDENGRGGAPALHRQPRQAVDVPPLRVVRLAAAQTEPELPRHEPERHAGRRFDAVRRSEEHTSELQSRENLVCRLLLEKKNAPE